MFQDETGVVITAYNKGLFGFIAVQGKSYKEAENRFWKMALDIYKHHESRSQELNRWKWFQKGNWKSIGGTWFTVFGIMVYFRYGKPMIDGWYIPFTNLNIRISNYWMKTKKP